MQYHASSWTQRVSVLDREPTGLTLHSHRHALHSSVSVKINPRALASKLDFYTAIRELPNTARKEFERAISRVLLDARHHVTLSLSCLKESRDHSRFSTAHSMDPNHVHLQQTSMDKVRSSQALSSKKTQHLLACRYPPHSELTLQSCQLRCHRHRTNSHKFLLHRSPLCLPLPPPSQPTALYQRRGLSRLSLLPDISGSLPKWGLSCHSATLTFKLGGTVLVSRGTH